MKLSVSRCLSSRARRAIAAAGGLALIAGLAVVPTVVTAAPAQAACSNRVVLPEKVSVTGRFKEATVKLQTNCADVYGVYTALYGPWGWDADFLWDEPKTDKTEYWDIYDWMPVGRYYTRDGEAVDSNIEPLPFTGDSVQLKLGSRTSMSTSRSGDYVTVRFINSRYFSSTGQFKRWGGSRAHIYYLKDGKWTWLVSPKTNSKGFGQWKFKAGPRTYKVCAEETSYAWSACSGTGRR